MVFLGGPRQVGKTHLAQTLQPLYLNWDSSEDRRRILAKDWPTGKLYLWDWSQVPEAGPRFENLVAGHLLKYCHFLEGSEGHRMELRFLRDIDKREVDFVVLKDRKPLFAVECKTGEKALSPHIPYFKARTAIPRFYQTHLGKNHRMAGESMEIIPFPEFCRKLGLP